MAQQPPLMPKATAVWLVDNTALTFEQIADFCHLHKLEVKGIADGDVAKGIMGQDPTKSRQLTEDEIKRCEGDSECVADAWPRATCPSCRAGPKARATHPLHAVRKSQTPLLGWSKPTRTFRMHRSSSWSAPRKTPLVPSGKRRTGTWPTFSPVIRCCWAFVSKPTWMQPSRKQTLRTQRRLRKSQPSSPCSTKASPRLLSQKGSSQRSAAKISRSNQALASTSAVFFFSVG